MPILLRSLLFNALFYLNLIAQMTVFSPVFFLLPEERAWRIVKNWARSSLWLLDHVAGTRSCIGGRENIPAGACIVAAKHQSFWETFALLPELDKPTFILKKELMHIPVFGWYARRMGMIPVDRKKGGSVLTALTRNAALAAAQGRQIIIFPEGTRSRAGTETTYRTGVSFLYRSLGLPVVPVALNSGLYWARRSVRRYPGTIRAEFLEAIPPGLEREAFFERLRQAIEPRSMELVREGLADRPDFELSEEFRRPGEERAV